VRCWPVRLKIDAGDPNEACSPAIASLQYSNAMEVRPAQVIDRHSASARLERIAPRNREFHTI
jgi:hypothetical protein